MSATYHTLNNKVYLELSNTNGIIVLQELEVETIYDTVYNTGILGYIVANGVVTAKQLRLSFGLTAPTLNKIIKKLIRAGFVNQHQSARGIYSYTEKGRKFYDSIISE